MTELARLRELFDALLDVPAEDWDEWIEQRGINAVTRESLLRLASAHRIHSGLLEHSLSSLTQALQRVPTTPELDPAGRRVGPFRILRRLGEGGMASVYLALREDADFEQVVALKLLRHGALSEIEQTFFRRERQVLARLSHPNIARLIDGGEGDDGVPYLAMEYVAGTSITNWCRERTLGLQERVVLVAKVARAVAAAHAALVVHRDIKPGNVLVDAEGEPRLLDFGIAKLLEAGAGERTHSGFAPMTPEYAAPEQFSGGVITTATDVYALGVLLHELVTGARPERGVEKAPSARLATMCEQGQASSLLMRQVRGDLDKIVLMALADDPARRYPGAAALADDLDRYLARKPVRAHPPSAWYRTHKFVQRHRGGVAITMLLVLGILVSTVLALWQARAAREEAGRATAVRDFVVDLLRRTTPDRPEAERPDIPALVYTAATSLQQSQHLDREARIELLLTLGNVLRQMRDLPRSEALLREAVASAGELPEDDSVRVSAQVELARTLLRKEDAVGAAQALAPVLRLSPRSLPDAVPHAMLLKLEMAIESTQGHRARALELGDAALAAYRADCADGVRCAEMAFAEHDLGLVKLGAGDVVAARVLLHAALDHKRANAAAPIAVAETLTGLSYIALLQGELDAAERQVQEAEQLMLGLGNGLSRPPIAQLRQRAQVLLAQQRVPDALPLLRQVVQDQETRGAPPCLRAENRVLLAQALLLARQVAEARPQADAAQREATACPSQDRLLNAAFATLVHGRIVAAEGDKAGATADFRQAMSERDRFEQASPMRRLPLLAESMRLSLDLSDAEAARREASSMLVHLDHVGALSSSPWRREARAVLELECEQDQKTSTQRTQRKSGESCAK